MSGVQRAFEDDAREIAGLQAEVDEWRQAASVEAGLRREFYGKAMAYRAALERIAIVCTDNMDRNCNHRMALDFVRQIANDAVPLDHS
jgi:hypothetical protein